MKKAPNVLFLACALLVSTAFYTPHPLKMTSSLIEYNAKKTHVLMECRVFIDDFENSIQRSFSKEINISTLSKQDKELIEAYFDRYFTIMVNDLNCVLKYKSSEVLEKQNVLSLKFSAAVSPLKKGDVFCIENRLFFRDFEFLQTNMTTVRIPPFVRENYFEAKHDDYSLPIHF